MAFKITDAYGNQFIVDGEQSSQDLVGETILLTIFDVEGKVMFYGFISHVQFSK